uniref:Multidrug resistance protein 1-like n=1 Tax=Phallusia mammillata TaxID=59560 RepID=A0A6F9D6A4_9ASCI|nr:multidrug resistance protein 1-like [Phallusia mammillata]
MKPVFVFLTLALTLTTANRKISIGFNPGCAGLSGCNGPNPASKLLYIKSEGDCDSIHYVWTFNQKSIPTLLILESSNNASVVSIDWQSFLHIFNSSIHGSIRLKCGKQFCEDSVLSSSVYVLKSIIQYNDTKNNADITDKGNLYVSSYDLSNLNWNISVSQEVNSFLVEGSPYNQTGTFSKDGKLIMKFTTKDKSGRGPLFPHLPYNDQSSMWEIILTNLTTAFVGSRFALDFLVVNPENVSFSGQKTSLSKTVKKITKWSIDDEYSPSVFTSQQILWVNISSERPSSYWLWRTVCYTNVTPSRAFSSDVQTTNLVLINKTTVTGLESNHLLLAIFGKSVIDKLPFKRFSISFGKPDDGFYRATEYLSWTSLVGVGEPPADSLSLMVVCIIFAGVGCPVLVILFGAVYLVVRRCRKHRMQRVALLSNYEPIG